MPVPEITVDELAARRADGAPLIDVRRPDEWVAYPAPGPVLIPLADPVAQLALLRLGWQEGDDPAAPTEVALVDTLAVDIAPLAKVLVGPATIVMHAATQDLEVLLLACGTLPVRLFDTQIAAGFLGYSTPS